MIGTLLRTCLVHVNVILNLKIEGFRPEWCISTIIISCFRYTILAGNPRNTVCLFGGCLTSQLHASVSQGRICSHNFTCCHTETEVADPTFYLTQSQYTDTGPTSPSADLIMPGAWQGSHWSASFQVTGMTRPAKIPSQAGFEPWIFRSRGGRLNHLASEVVLKIQMYIPLRPVPKGNSLRR